jgi:hypothetical protein
VPTIVGIEGCRRRLRGVALIEPAANAPGADALAPRERLRSLPD